VRARSLNLLHIWLRGWGGGGVRGVWWRGSLLGGFLRGLCLVLC